MKSDGYYQALAFCMGYSALILWGIIAFIDYQIFNRKNKRK